MTPAEYMRSVNQVNHDPELSAGDRIEIQRKLAQEVDFDMSPKIIFQGEAVATNSLAKIVRSEER